MVHSWFGLLNKYVVLQCVCVPYRLSLWKIHQQWYISWISWHFAAVGAIVGALLAGLDPPRSSWHCHYASLPVATSLLACLRVIIILLLPFTRFTWNHLSRVSPGVIELTTYPLWLGWVKMVKFLRIIEGRKRRSRESALKLVGNLRACWIIHRLRSVAQLVRQSWEPSPPPLTVFNQF